MKRSLVALLAGGAMLFSALSGVGIPFAGPAYASTASAAVAAPTNASADAPAKSQAVEFDKLKAGETIKGTGQQLTPGVTYYSLTGKDWSGLPLRGHVVEIDPKKAKMELYLALGGDALGKKETLSKLASRHGAVAAINGGFFDSSSGYPIGGLVYDGRLMAASDFMRTSVGVVGKTGLNFGYFDPKVELRFGGGQALAVDAVNSRNVSGGIILFTPDWGNSAGAVSGATEVVVAGDGKGGYIVKEINSGGSVIPKDGFVVSFTGDKAASAGGITTGMPVKMTIDYGANWQGLRNLITAGPLLVEQGQPVLQAELEGYRGSVLDPAPRSAIGENSAGHIMLVEVDGRQANWSTGLTLEEMSYLLVDLGARRASALDGGGSSAIWVKDKVVNRPSDGGERALANAILVLPDQVPVYLDGKRLFFDVPPLVEKGRTFVPMRGIFEALGAELKWDQESKTVTAVKGSKTISLTINKREAVIDGKVSPLDAPARVVEGRTLVPLRFVGEALGAGVTWRNAPPAVIIKAD